MSHADEIFNQMNKELEKKAKEKVPPVILAILNLLDEKNVDDNTGFMALTNIIIRMTEKAHGADKAKFLGETLQKFFDILAKNQIKETIEKIENDLKNR